mgnify:CR=1 FL=1
MIDESDCGSVPEFARAGDGYRFHTTGLTHDERGYPATNATAQAELIPRLIAKIRDNRFSRFRHTCVMHGSGHLFVGNHMFQGDGDNNGVRVGSLILTLPNPKVAITGNYIDNASIEWTNEHDATPDFAAEFSFGGLTITGNMFTKLRHYGIDVAVDSQGRITVPGWLIEKAGVDRALLDLYHRRRVRTDDFRPEQMPRLEDLALALAASGDGPSLEALDRKYPTGALSVFEFQVDSWADIREGTGHLHSFVLPRRLS